jgi:Tfp pilus assembly protein PilF
VDAWHLLGVVRAETHDYAAAVSCFDRVLQRDRASIQAWFRRGNALLSLRRHEAALESFERALALEPRHSVVVNAQAVALESLGRRQEAAERYRAAIALEPASATPHSNLGRMLREGGDLAAAIACFRTAIALRPDFAMAHNNLGCALYDVGDLAESAASYQRALCFDPSLAEAEYNLALALLKAGDFTAGWRAFESRLHTTLRATLSPPPGLERWAGEDLRGRTLVVVAEHGYGDVIHFCRYGALLNAVGIRPVLQIEPALTELLRTSGYFADFVAPGTIFPRDSHVWYPLLSLPLLFGTVLEHIPATAAYLRPEPARAQRWRERLLAFDGLRVGIVWEGNRRSEVGSLRGRSMPTQELAPLAALDGVTLISLQKHGGSQQLARIPWGTPVVDWTHELDCGADAFVDTAALIANLDLVISVDTAVAHLAGALGQPVWVALHRASDWRWLTARSDTPWYPSMRLFRQTTADVWQSVIAAMRVELESRV